MVFQERELRRHVTVSQGDFLTLGNKEANKMVKMPFMQA